MRNRNVIASWVATAGAAILAGSLVLGTNAAGAPVAAAHQVERVVTDGLAGPTSEAVSGTDVWITDRTGDALTEITSTGRLVRRVSGARYRFDRPGPIAAARGVVWVGSRSGLTEVAAGSGALVRTVPSRALRMGRPAALVVAGENLVVVGAGGAVAEIGLSSGRPVRTAGPGATGLLAPGAATMAGPDLWVADTRADAVVELRVADLHRVRTVSAAADRLGAPDGIGFDGTHLWVADRTAVAATELTTTGRLVRVISNATGSYGFDQPGAVLAWGGYTFISSPPGSSPMITQVTDATGRPDWYMCNTNGPYHFADPTGLAVVRGRLWVANASGDSLTEMDATTGALIATIP